MTTDSVLLGRAARLALWTWIGTAAAFTAFAWVTTQVPAVRAGSPWQDDPHDGVVSFTEFLVPALALLTVLRAALWRRDRPQPVFRIDQLLRASVVGTVLVAMTVATDALAVVLGADRPLWDGTTPWLVAALVPLALACGVGFALQRRALRRLPASRCGGDWLDDLEVLCGCAVRAVRGHVTAAALLLSLAAALGITTAEAVGEGWTSPLLFLTGTVVGTGGFFGFAMIADATLHVAGPRTRPVGQVRAAARVAGVAGALALPVVAVLRDPLRPVVGPVDSPDQLAVLVAMGAGAVAALAFVGTLAFSRGAPRPAAP